MPISHFISLFRGEKTVPIVQTFYLDEISDFQIHVLFSSIEFTVHKIMAFSIIDSLFYTCTLRLTLSIVSSVYEHFHREYENKLGVRDSLVSSFDLIRNYI